MAFIDSSLLDIIYSSLIFVSPRLKLKFKMEKKKAAVDNTFFICSQENYLIGVDNA